MRKTQTVTESITYDETEGVYRATFTPERENPSEAVILVLAEITETTPYGLDPLYERIDPEGLDNILSARPSKAADEAPTVTFVYQDYEVTITGAGTLAFRPQAGESPS